MSLKNKSEFNEIVEDIINNEKFIKLDDELHHGITRYKHSYSVDKCTYKVCK